MRYTPGLKKKTLPGGLFATIVATLSSFDRIIACGGIDEAVGPVDGNGVLGSEHTEP